MVEMGNVWDRTTAFVSDNLRALWPIAVPALLVPHAIRALIGRVGDSVPPFTGSLVGLACILVALWGQLAVVALALDPAGGRGRAMARASAGYGRALGAMALVFAVLLVLALPAIGIVVASGGDLAALRRGGMTTADLSAGAAGGVAIYALILAVVVFVAAIRLALLYPVILNEGGVIAAMRRSVALTRGITWAMIGVWLLFGIVYIVAWLAATSAAGVVIGLFSDDPRAFSVADVVVALVGGAVSMALAVIVAAFSANLYRAATLAREGVAAA